MSKDLKWSENLKAGDTVIVCTGIGYREYYLAKFERYTKTQIITSRGRFRRGNLNEVGAGEWNSRRLLEATKERIEEIQREALAKKISGVKFKSLSYDKLKAIKAILEEK